MNRPRAGAGAAPLPLPDDPSGWALFLDFDGTLAEIAPTPGSVVVDAELPEILARLHRSLGGAVAVVSGRRVAELDRFLEPLILPAAGLHGLERRFAPGHRASLPPPPPALAAQRPCLQQAADAHTGLRLEDKGHSLALHFRAAPALDNYCRDAMRAALAAMPDGYHLLAGKMVYELKLTAADKGRAVTEFLARPPFVGRQPVFVGDDVTDEDAFAVVNRAGGISVRVGERTGTLAQRVVESVDAVHLWLQRVADRLASGVNTL